DAVVPAERSEQLSQILASMEGLPADARMLWAASSSGDYPAYIGPGLLGFWPRGVVGRRFVVTDENVGSLYGRHFEPLAGRIEIEPGERSKTLASADRIWHELTRAGVTRQDVVAALGGGVVGDLAGF